MKNIAYQGMPGSFSHITAVKHFNHGCRFIGLKRFREIFELLEKGEAHYGVIPIENSLAGSIHENYDLLDKHEVWIIDEAYTRIEHFLMSVTDESGLKGINKVYSHPKALEQCTRFFEEHPWISPVVHEDTAGAAAEIAKSEDAHCAAIASEAAAGIYGLKIIKRNIEDDSNNYTRFVFVTKNKDDTKQNATKCSLILRLKHKPGSLYRFLAKFADNGINLTKIESRPLKGTLFEYIFYLDFEFTENEIDRIKNLLNEIHAETELIKVLGLY